MTSVTNTTTAPGTSSMASIWDIEAAFPDASWSRATKATTLTFTTDDDDAAAILGLIPGPLLDHQNHSMDGSTLRPRHTELSKSERSGELPLEFESPAVSPGCDGVYREVRVGVDATPVPGSPTTADARIPTSGARKESIKSRNVYVAALPLAFSDADLEALLVPFGTLLSRRMFADTKNAEVAGRAYGFALFETAQAAEASVAGLTGKVIDGRTIQIRLSKNGVVKKARPNPKGVGTNPSTPNSIGASMRQPTSLPSSPVASGLVTMLPIDAAPRRESIHIAIPAPAVAAPPHPGPHLAPVQPPQAPVPTLPPHLSVYAPAGATNAATAAASPNPPAFAPAHFPLHQAQSPYAVPAAILQAPPPHSALGAPALPGLHPEPAAAYYAGAVAPAAPPVVYPSQPWPHAAYAATPMAVPSFSHHPHLQHHLPQYSPAPAAGHHHHHPHAVHVSPPQVGSPYTVPMSAAPVYYYATTGY